MRQCVVFICLFIMLRPAFGQKSDNERALINEFINELKKGDINISERDFNSATDQRGIKIELITEQDAAVLRLPSHPVDGFYIKGNNQSLVIKSTSGKGLRNGVFWYLHYLGFRYYFPNDNWHFIPKHIQLYQNIDTVVVPDFFHRRIWYAYGTGSKKADKDYSFWVKTNLLGGENVNAGHAYGGIVQRNKAVFQQHPEFFAQKVAKGVLPGNAKFNVANSELVELCISDAFKQVDDYKRKNGFLPDMISMDPSDGGGFSTSPESLRIGGPSEQVFYLANKVAKAIHTKYPGVKVGLYAYNYHSEPPKFSLESNIVVLIATKMSKSKFRLEELIDLWKKKNIQLGIREYYGVMAWDWDMPGRPAGAKVYYVTKLKEYYKDGARVFSGETNNGWISRGIGHYIAARMLWNTDINTDKVQKEIYTNMFGQAAKHMESLFKSWQTQGEVIPLAGQIKDWFDLLQKAGKAESNEKVHRRIDDIKKYLHFVILYKRWKASNTDEHLIELLNYAYRIQDESLVASYALFRRIANTAVAHKANMKYNDPSALWKKNNKPVDAKEVERNFSADLAGLDITERKIVSLIPDSFSIKGATQLRSAKPVGLASPVRLRGTHKIIFHISDMNDASRLFIKGGLTKGGTHKSVIVKIFKYTSDLTADDDNLALEEVVDVKKEKNISLHTLSPGFYMAIIDDAKSGFLFSFSNDITYGILAGSGGRVWTLTRGNFFFLVDDNSFKVDNKGVMTLVSPKGRVVNLQSKKGLSQINISPEERGIWQMKDQKGEFSLIQVLPLVSRKTTLLSNP